MAGMGAAGRRRVPARAEAPPARAATPRPFVQRRAPGPLQVGEWSGGGGESRGRPGPRAARSACAPRSAGLRGARKSGLFGCRARLIVRQVRGRPAAGRAAKVGGGRAGGGGRRPRARLVVGVSVFFLKTLLRCAGGAFRPPGPAGDVRAAAAANAGLRAAHSVQLVSSIVADPVSHFAAPLAAARLAGCPFAPHPAPRDPRPGQAPRARHPAVERGGGRRGGGRDGLGNLRERRRVAGTAASLPGRARKRVESRTGRGRRALLPPALTVVGNEKGISPVLFFFSYAPVHPRKHFGPRCSLAEPFSSALGPTRSGPR